jgi:hypothetical protein
MEHWLVSPEESKNPYYDTKTVLALKTMPFFSQLGNELGAAKDAINGMVSNGITIIKDSMP